MLAQDLDLGLCGEKGPTGMAVVCRSLSQELLWLTGQ